jgi:hypothetical protein
MFIRNLGAMTAAPSQLIPDMGNNGRESDGRPSTFWITNPTNIFTGNVAAGSMDSGFWFEPLLRGDRADDFPNLDPKHETLTEFKDNVAHSNAKIGLRAYPSGYRPVEIAVIEDFKAYRNTKGVFLHLSRNIKIQRGLFADNRQGVEIDRADNIDVESATFIGISKSFRDLMTSQRVKNVCGHGSLVGIEHHAWKNDPNLDGSCMRNLTFSGFLDTGCSQSFAINVDKRVSGLEHPFWLAMLEA